MNLYPLKFKPIFKQRIWGGQKLREVFNKDIPPFEKIGESWELADLPNDKSIIANGELAGQTLSSVIQKFPKEITGNENFSPPFPLLIKFLDAQDILSVQVHPDRQTCRRLGEGEPKTECWYIISAEADAVIYKGLKKGVTKQQFAEAIKNGTVAELLAKVPVEAGQCHFLPAGTAHSIGAGLLIAEIQTPSDTTYRVFDFNRVDDSGKPRPLHIEQALESINFDMDSTKLPVTTVGRLMDCEYFKIDKGHQAVSCEVFISPGQMKILIILTGSGTILSADTNLVEFRAGDTLLIPAAYEGAIRFTDDTQYLTVTSDSPMIGKGGKNINDDAFPASSC
jgi:mannose-6-phosphate isomerase